MPILLCALAATRAFAAQTTDTNADFLRALAQFSLGLDGAYGDEGQSVASSLDSMERGLDAWDAAIRTAEATMRREIARAEPAVAARTHAVLGGTYLDRGRVADAMREFAAAIQLDPTGADIHTIQGLVYDELLDEPDPATVAFQTASTLDPRNPVRWYVLARHLVKVGKPAEARNAFQAAYKSWEQRATGKGRTGIDSLFTRLGLVQEKARVEPFFAPVLYADGFALLRQGDYKGAIAQFREAAARDPLTARPFERMEAMNRAAVAFRDGSVQAAEDYLKVAVELQPMRSEPHRMLGAVYLADERYDEAIDELRTAVRLSPEDERTHLALADALVKTRRYAEAETALRKTLDALPGSGRARYTLGRLYQRQGKYEDALRELSQTVAFHPMLGLNGIYQSIGAIHAARQNFDGAVGAYLARAAVHPNDPDAHQDLGDVYLRLGRHDEALAEFAVVLMLAPGRSGAYAAMAQVHLKEGRYADAAEVSRRALDLDPAHEQARYALATALLRLGRTDEGQKELDEFQRLQSEAAVAHARELELGGLRREAEISSAGGDHQRAVSLLRKALELEPNVVVSHLNLGLALLYAGQPAEAIERFKSAEVLNAGFEIHRHMAEAYALLGQVEESRRQLAIYDRMKQESLRRAGAGR